ncbi:MAG TPA: hypothetical protein DDW52_09325, partial [Planctomycetaceae bacterium]|nr:hypothetical protein [Planctomycetaceae bacterium]
MQMADLWNSAFGWLGNFSVSFEYHWALLLLVAIPVLWLTSYQSMASLGPGRRLGALLLRSLLLLLIICAVAGLQWVWSSNKLTVIYLLDQSDSIPRAKREVMLEYAIKNVEKHRDATRKDRSGLIVFGREAAIEFPPYDENLPVVRGVESYFGPTDATNLESALKLAQAAFPEDSARRVVIVTDGVETLGNAGAVAQQMSESGIGIDVVPIKISSGSEVLVEKVDVPTDIRRGQPFETRVVVSKYDEPGADSGPVSGRLRLIRSVGASEQKVTEKDGVILDKDVNVFSFTDQLDVPAGYMYRAEFIPEAGRDTLKQNNRADAYTFVRGKGRVLMIVDWTDPEAYQLLEQSLQRSDIEVTVQSSNELFTSLGELQAYDCVILAGVARSSGDSADSISNFSDEQLEMLQRNTQQFGAGLIMVGGERAFGAGGWTNTVIEEAMPVDFQIKNTKIEAVGALAMILHASEIARGNYWQKKIGQAALEVLGPMDYCGVVTYDQQTGVDKWLWGGSTGMVRVQNNRQIMISRMRAMTPGDMPAFQPSMQLALRSLKATRASLKHMIIISDGDPTPPAGGVLSQFASMGVKISTVAVGAHGQVGHATLKNISNTTGGTYYEAKNPTALPKIFQREAMRVSKPLVYEPEGGVSPAIVFPHEVVQGLSRDLPPLSGYVLTTVKNSPLVEVPIRANKPTQTENQTILATWQYGLGRTAVFTSDAGRLWASQWTAWDGYDQFFAQLVRWAMRPSKSDAKFSIATNVEDGQVKVVVNALTQDDSFLNFLDMQAVAVGPDLKPLPLVMRQVAPGRYVGSFASEGAGAYLVNVLPGAGMAPITAGASVPFSDEYRIQQTNYTMLEQLASLEPDGGRAGVITDPLEAESLPNVLESDAYRGGLENAMSMQDIWHWCVLLGAICLLGDVFVRRVAVDYLYPLKKAAAYLRPHERAADQSRQESLQRLRNRKSEVSGEMESARASARFEADPNASSTEIDELNTTKQTTKAGGGK